MRFQHVIVTLFSAILLITLAGCQTSPASFNGNLQRHRFEEEHMGAWWSITLYAPSEAEAREAAAAAFAKVRELDERLTDYAPDSELSMLRLAQPGMPFEVSRVLFDAIHQSVEIARMTDGAFDPTVGPFIRLWRTARQLRILPAELERQRAAEAIGWQKLSLDVKHSTVTFARPSMRLDLGGIAKGMGADAALTELKRRGFPRAMVAASGDLALGDPPPGKSGWTVGVASLDGREGDYSRLLLLKNCGVSTSGDTEQYVTIGGVRYSHIVDPRTGIGLTNRIQATVIAPTATASDALATAVCVKGAEQGIMMVEGLLETAAFVTTVIGDKRQEVESKRFSTLPFISR